MELDEMKAAWKLLDQKLERQQQLDLAMFRDHKRDEMRRRLRPLWWGQMVQILGGALLMGLFAPYWVEHLDSLHLAVYGLSLHTYGLLMVLTAARNLYLQGRLDYAAPVLEIQRRVAALRRWRLREAVLHSLAGCFMWIPLILVGFQQLGADVWLAAPAVVWSFLASGMACLGIMYGLIRWQRSRVLLERSSIGRSVLETQALVDELARFEKD